MSSCHHNAGIDLLALARSLLIALIWFLTDVSLLRLFFCSVFLGPNAAPGFARLWLPLGSFTNGRLPCTMNQMLRRSYTNSEEGVTDAWARWSSPCPDDAQVSSSLRSAKRATWPVCFNASGVLHSY